MGYETRGNEVVYLGGAGERLAWVTFPPAVGAGPGTVEIDRTFVDPSLRGQGVAGELMARAAEAIRSTGRRAQPTCSYAAAWFERHPEARDLLA